jgi:3-oxoacyl-[acyl-carrier-protein] synthase-3
MSLPELYVSKPGVSLPETRVDNAETIRRVRAQFKGTDEEWVALASAIEQIFHVCKTRYRYLDSHADARVADHGVAAAKNCLEVNHVDLDEVDLVINGGVARQYYEPATAMEIAAKLDLERTHAFDLTAACVGHCEAIQTAAAYLTLHPEYRAALVVTSELSGQDPNYDIQSVRELPVKAAGLTMGTAAACVLVRRTPFPAGSLRVLHLATITVPDHGSLGQVPTGGTLDESSGELMRLGRLMPSWVREQLTFVGLQPEDVSYYVYHQPSDPMVRKIVEDIGVDAGRGVYTHALYGNTASASVGVTYMRLLAEKTLRPGDKVVLGSAAPGVGIVMVLAEWVAGGVPAARFASASSVDQHD